MTLFTLVLTLFIRLAGSPILIGSGIHPSVANDPVGGIHVVYGQGNAILYAFSRDGKTFSKPVLVDSLPNLQLGASRGPQITATAQKVIVLATDKPGNVWAYSMDRKTGKWPRRVQVNDVADIAKEGFVALTANEDNVINAVWLDLRGNRRNKIAGCYSTDGGKTWSPNQILYQSPDGTVCECCQVSAVSRGAHVAIMFRNYLAGSRDMYLLESTDAGKTFGQAQKIGEGTWELKACPMDGGGLFMAPDGTISTVWRRTNKLFTDKPGQPEREIAEGKNAKIVSTRKGEYIVFQQGANVFVLAPGQSEPQLLGKGAYPKIALVPPEQVMGFWEADGSVWAQLVQ
ncbi:sialidase family protein [Spirosoma sp. SC4-14]|uniref:sialidase family protein n=1 Tax=Spirosoma sp. SC4-14 TaxID=3128900 RepID=UPI0030CD6D2A